MTFSLQMMDHMQLIVHQLTLNYSMIKTRGQVAKLLPGRVHLTLIHRHTPLCNVMEHLWEICTFTVMLFILLLLRLL